VTDPTEIPRRGSFRDRETELLKFAVDLRCAPACILFCHLADEPSNLLGDLRSPAARTGSPMPVQAEAGAMPTDDSLGLGDDENISLAGPATAKICPEESVQRV